jgi:hypothetical protein
VSLCLSLALAHVLRLAYLLLLLLCLWFVVTLAIECCVILYLSLSICTVVLVLDWRFAVLFAVFV